MAILNSNLNKTSPAEAMTRRKVEQRGPSTVLTFPANLGAHGMLMRFFTYTYGGPKGSEETPVAEVMLPLPKQLQDSFKINVGSDELGLLGTTIAGFSAGGGGGLADSLSKFASASAQAGVKAADTVAALTDFKDGQPTARQTQAVSDAKTAINNVVNGLSFTQRAALNKIIPDASNGIAVGKGNALNPFATLVFKGVDLKVHNLEWTLSPESEEEAMDLKRIIRTLQRMALPTTSGLFTGEGSGPGDEFFTGQAALDRGLLKYPSMVNIYLMGVDQNYYFKFKTSMISQLNVDYSPGGLSINKGGKPSQVGITMTLNEAFIHTAEDYSVKELIQEEIQEAIDDRIVDILTSNDGETREFNPDTVQTSDGQPLNVTNTSDVRSDEVLVTRTLPDGSTSSQILTQTELINQGFGEQVAQLQASPGNTVATGIDGVEFTKGS